MKRIPIHEQPAPIKNPPLTEADFIAAADAAQQHESPVRVAAWSNAVLLRNKRGMWREIPKGDWEARMRLMGIPSQRLQVPATDKTPQEASEAIAAGADALSDDAYRSATQIEFDRVKALGVISREAWAHMPKS
ncbi:hypothetical protein [Sulfuriroseicoccus oceanibius]|uniref:Uncharacterized protein n=1 Tax=Sulfuriroseicoccus oceanibius TaxID=2707525 RepID=A0A6B3L210_9BACT|nr:hypothetical protein [Sulfuriroseicoccus oceanibius]QQL44236.1 hypothetical protein G3M56_010055 [Sulfuriroseicoccus oceanibius]